MIHLRQTGLNHIRESCLVLIAFEVFGAVAGLEEIAQGNTFSPSPGDGCQSTGTASTVPAFAPRLQFP
jgi:hypothetical protein